MSDSRLLPVLAAPTSNNIADIEEKALRSSSLPDRTQMTKTNDLIKENITYWINQVLGTHITPQSLFDELQDGIILYKVLHAIDPNASLNQITEHAQPGSIRARHNFTAFLQHIKNDLNCDKIRQFEPDQFIERTDHEPLIDCVLDLIDYASREKGFPSLSINAAYLIERERLRSRYSTALSKISAARMSNHRPSSIATYSKSSRSVSISRTIHAIGGISENLQTAMSPRILVPVLENEVDPGSDIASENITTVFDTIPEHNSLNVSFSYQPEPNALMESSDKYPPYGISDILRYFYGTLMTFPEESRLQSMCEMVMQNSSEYYAEIAEEESRFQPITAIQVVVDHKDELPDENFTIIQNGGWSVDINQSGGSRQLYLAVSRNCDHAAITDIQLQESDHDSMPPYGFNKILRSVSGLPGNLNFGTGKSGLYLCYRHGPAAPIIDVRISQEPQLGYRTLPQRLHTLGEQGNEPEIKKELAIHYRPRLMHIIEGFESCFDGDRGLEGCTASEALHLYYSRASALLCLTCYSANATLVHHCLHYIGVLGTLPSDMIPSRPVNRVGNVPCDSSWQQWISYELQLLCTLFSLCPSLSTESLHLLNLVIKVSHQIYLHNLHHIHAYTAIQYAQTLTAYSQMCPDVLQSLLNHMLKRRSPSYLPASPQHRSTSMKQWVRDYVLGSVLDQVMYSKVVLSIASAIKDDLIDENWIKIQSELISDIVSNNEQSQIVGMLVLLSAILAEPPDSYIMTDPNEAIRPEHAQVLDFIIQICDFGHSRLKASGAAILTLRRVVVPTAIEACITGTYRQSHFQRLLKLFILLFRKYTFELKTELGAWLHSVLLDLLECKSSSLLQKNDILEAMELLLNSAQQVIDIFYNFDGSHEPLPIYERLVMILSNICIEAPLQEPSGTHSNHSFSPNAELLHLKRSAMSMLVNLLEMQSRWLASRLITKNVYHTPLSSSPPSSPSSKKARNSLNSTPSISPRNQKSSLLPPSSTDTLVQHRRRSSWREQMVSRDVHHQAIQKALSLAASSSLGAAIRYLVLVEHSKQRRAIHGIQWRPVAVFLYRARTLNQGEVGEFLGSERDEAFSSQDFDDLRRAFTDLLDFTNRSFELSLRSFVNDSGFWMPDSKVSCERLLMAFCEAYCRDNSIAFKSVAATFKLASASYFLREDDNLDFTQWSQTFDDDTLDDGHRRELFSSIKLSPLVRKQERLTYRKIENDETKREKLLVEHSENSVHNALAIIRIRSAYKNRYLSGNNSVNLVVYMFDEFWVQFLGCLSSPIINSFVDNELILNGLMHGTICALLLGKLSETNSFLSVLAKYAYLCSTKDTPERQKITIVSGGFMTQDWIVKFKSLEPKPACDLLIDVVHDIRNQMSFNSEKSRIAQIQLTLSSPIDLFSGERRMIALQGDFTRLCKAGKSTIMHRVYMFNDLILYGKLDRKSHLVKTPRVLHLLTCKAQNYDTPQTIIHKFKSAISETKYAFEIRSRRKNLIFFATSQDERNRWITRINDSVPGLLHIHHQRMEAIKGGIMSAGTVKSEQSCFYCLRYFTVFNRKHECDVARWVTLIKKMIDNDYKTKRYLLSLSRKVLRIQAQRLNMSTSFLNLPVNCTQEQTLPDHLEKIIPESKLFIALLRLEQRIDANVTRSRLQATEMLCASNSVYRILRIFLSHQVTDNNIAIQIQGQLVNPDTGNLDMNRHKFSDFILSAVVVLDSNIFRGKSYSEWTRSNEVESVDGFELCADLPDPLSDSFCRIQLMLDDYPKRYTVPENLSGALGCQQETFERLMMALWAYIKRNNLQDAEDPMTVVLNDFLAEIFGCSQISLDQIGASLLSLLSPAEPITFMYHLTMIHNPSMSRQVYEIALQIPQKDAQEKFVHVDKNVQDKVEELNLRCNELLKQIAKHQRRYEAMLAFGESPVDVVRLQLEIAKQNLKILQYGSPQASVSAARRSIIEDLAALSRK